MTAAKQQLQDQLREHVRNHGVIAGWRVWEECGPLTSDAERLIRYQWVCEVLTPTGDPMRVNTLWIERQPAEVGAER
jgi:hypothetical protein